MPDAHNYGDGLVPIEHPHGVWVAYYSDRSGACVFGSEVEALRAAVVMSAQVVFVRFGHDVWDAARDARDARVAGVAT